MKYLEEQIHKHHIVPRYKCKELGINPDFPENLIELTRLEHANIHWWMYLDERKDVFNLLESKGVKITSFLTEHIPWQDARDVGAAALTALGEIDGLDMSGKNNPAYKDGRTYDKKAYHKAHNAIPKQIAKRKAYRETPEAKARAIEYGEEYRQRPEVKERMKEFNELFRLNNPDYYKEYHKKYGQTPQRKSYLKEYNKLYYLKNKDKIKEYQQTPEYKSERKAYMKEYMKAHKLTPEQKAKKKEYNKLYYLKKKALDNK